MLPPHSIYKLYLWMYDKNKIQRYEYVIAGITFLSLLKNIVALLVDREFRKRCKNAHAHELKLCSGNGDTTNLPDYSGIFLKRCEEFNISRAEREVLYYKIKLFSDKDVGKRLFCSPRTVTTHLTHIYDKMDVHSIELAIYRLTH